MKQITTAAMGYEQSRKSAGAIKKEQGQDTDECRRVFTERQLEDIVAKIQGGSVAKSKSRTKEMANPTRTMQISTKIAHRITDRMCHRSAQRLGKLAWCAKRIIVLQAPRHARAQGMFAA